MTRAIFRKSCPSKPTMSMRAGLWHLLRLTALSSVLSMSGTSLLAPKAAVADTAQQQTTGPYIGSHMYRYNPDGTVTDVTAMYNSLGYIYDWYGNPIHVTVDAIGHVYDFDFVLVGFVYRP